MTTLEQLRLLTKRGKAFVLRINDKRTCLIRACGQVTFPPQARYVIVNAPNPSDGPSAVVFLDSITALEPTSGSPPGDARGSNTSPALFHRDT